MLRRAVFETVRSGDVVLDAGCGSGLLAVWAAQAGADLVVAVDMDDLGLARGVAEENGVASRIEFVCGDLRSLEFAGLEKACNVIMAMIYLNDPRRDLFQAKLAYELRDQFLKPGGRMVPDRVEYEAIGYDWPAQDVKTRLERLARTVRDLEARLDLKLRSLHEAVRESPDREVFPARSRDGVIVGPDARVLTGAGAFCTVDYGGEFRGYPEEFVLSADADGVLNTIVWTQRLLWGGRLLFANESVSWVRNPWLVRAGEEVCLSMDDGFYARNELHLVER